MIFQEVLQKSHDKYGYIDKRGREVVEPIYDYVSNIKDNVVVLVKGDKVGVMHIK